MRVLLWHGWLLEGTGSNVYTARVAEELVRAGHDVALLCQERHPEDHPWIETWGTVDEHGTHDLTPARRTEGPGRCTMLRPSIGSLLPVFVLDEYEGFQAKRFVDLTDDELTVYLDRNAAALRAAVAWHRSEVVITGHAVPGGEIGRRALGSGRFITKIHGSDMEYAMRPQVRYRELAAIGLGAARAVTGSSADAIARCVEMVPEIADRVRVVSPGVDAERFHPAPRRSALLETAASLDADAEPGGRPSSLDAEVARALATRDEEALDALAAAYDQTAPDLEAAARLRALATYEGDLVGYLGKLIPQKGVDLLFAGVRASARRPVALVVGFGLHREWLVALAQALDEGSADAIEWLVDAGRVGPDVLDAPISAVPTIFTGRLDHRFAPGALAAMDVLVVPSILDEAFGMVAAEGAAAGALPLVARHSGLAEVAGSLEAETGRPGLFSFEPGPGAARRLGESL
ncbi:MAG: glycosyltransferase, partial [Actinomycetota bacterium]